MIKPEGIILHDTAGRLDKGNCVSWFLKKEASASAHLVVERDGSVTQMVPFNIKAWHAGSSILDGRSGCNGFSIGIEIVNPGKLEKTEGGYRSWFKKVYTEADGDIRAASSRYHGDGYWMDYTEAQINSVTDICSALATKYDMNFIEPHWFVSPGRKRDTNPLFPLDHLRTFALGRGDNGVERVEKRVVATSLNVRGGAGIGFEKMEWGPLRGGGDS
ncbi:N-acetylmuramoyl-L-alanine amidase [Mariprofundus ferrinatatus]|uniref:N-acetylmuramoyl-L-alanine amidase n=1 Tax=Mariprofundus ferrinatatus TaxID=1921087 RepID=A0A2K8L2R7_9PROT|nr:N-acetylmuramoyl-L-alanine amidase [Mariprofundus ferrinatatus]ATX81587.1 N-acetylmuramoyl-L-alanine amidase [Mariprofundus ferrinatatus]